LPGVTYAPWYDAARFDKRSRAYFDARGQLRQISINLKSCADEILGRHSALLVCLLILASVAPAVFLRRVAAAWFCVIPTLVVVGMYLLVHLVGRFMIGFSLVIWSVLFSSIRVPARYEALMRRALGWGIAVFAACTLPGIAHLLISRPQNLIQRELVIAEALPVYGIRPGDGVGVIGDGQSLLGALGSGVNYGGGRRDGFCFFLVRIARLAATVVSSMAALGAKAVIWSRDSDHPCPRDWTELPGDSGCIIECKVPRPLQIGPRIAAARKKLDQIP
jgi:hypothetical protein